MTLQILLNKGRSLLPWWYPHLKQTLVVAYYTLIAALLAHIAEAI